MDALLHALPTTLITLWGLYIVGAVVWQFVLMAFRVDAETRREVLVSMARRWGKFRKSE